MALNSQTTVQPAPGAGHKRVLGMASPYYQVGAPFEALGEGVLMAPSKSIGYFFAISSCPEVRCVDINIPSGDQVGAHF